MTWLRSEARPGTGKASEGLQEPSGSCDHGANRVTPNVVTIFVCPIRALNIGMEQEQSSMGNPSVLCCCNLTYASPKSSEAGRQSYPGKEGLLLLCCTSRGKNLV